MDMTLAPCTAYHVGAPNRYDPIAFSQMSRLVADMRHLYAERKQAARELARAHHEALVRLAMAAEMRDDDTGAHIVRMGYLAEALAQEIGLPRQEAAMLRRAAPLHDVGKIGIPDRVLKKAGPLTGDEREVMKRHPELGAGIFGGSRVPLLQMAAEVALTHHERWDGTGYPNGLAGEQIPVHGRVAAVADFFDALTMDRCYRDAYDDDTALAMLREQRGTAFDPDLVDAFVDAAPRMVALRDRINAGAPSVGALMEALL
jgi:putative two-component system response regulator